MTKSYFPHFGLPLMIAAAIVTTPCAAQENESDIHVIVNMVQVNVAVTDDKGNYVTGLHPEDFVITEDGIQERIATFEEGNEPARRVESDPGAEQAATRQDKAMGDVTGSLASAIAGSNVYILFDTSNYMYRGFVFAQDAIADFVRSLENA